MMKKITLSAAILMVLLAALAYSQNRSPSGEANRRPTPTARPSPTRQPGKPVPTKVNIGDRLFETPAVIFLVVFALAAGILGLIIGLVAGENEVALLRGLEAMVLAFLGGFLARSLIGVMSGLAGDSPGAGLAVGWGFLVWPGLVDTFPKIASVIGNTKFQPLLTAPENLMWIASGVGAFTGMMDGIWRIHNWKGLGWLSFPIDVTWGLAGVTNGALLHLINFAWGDHGTETRKGAHRYQSGFGLKPGFAFTQGSVMSNLSNAPGDALYNHERTHVWQNRGFGPLFVLTYVGWMVVWFLPGMIAGWIVQAGAFQGVEKWCYFNNPWEVWGYAVQGAQRTNIIGVTAQQARLIWPALFVILWAIPFFGLATVMVVVVLVNTW